MTSDTQLERRTYQTPQLKLYGNVASCTSAGTGAVNETAKDGCGTNMAKKALSTAC